MDVVNAAGFDEDNPIPSWHGFSVTVPGAAAAWVDCVEQFGGGQLNMQQILQPAIDLAEKGFPVSQMTSRAWEGSKYKIQYEMANSCLRYLVTTCTS